MKLLFVLCATILVANAAVVEQQKVSFQDAQLIADLPVEFQEYQISEYESTSWCLLVSLFFLDIFFYKSKKNLKLETRMEIETSRNQWLWSMARFD